MISIQVSDLEKEFVTANSKTKALNKLSTVFHPGVMHGVIGPEGAGKTTLLRHLAGLLKAHAGNIEFRQDDNVLPFELVRPQIAYMPQQQSLYADLSIEEHLNFFRDLYGLENKEFKQRSETLLEVTRLAKFLDRPAGKLSGGMYKKLGLMCALLASPQVLLLDEPTNGVDPISRREFWELLYHLSGEKILIIMATAYMDEAERCAYVHLIDSGRIIGSGEPKQLLQQVNAKSFDEYFMKADEGSTYAE